MRTLPREGLWLAQTPQMFRAGELRMALDACVGDPRVTDEASAVELACAPTARRCWCAARGATTS